MSCSVDTEVSEDNVSTEQKYDITGFDYEFDPPLDDKFQCPICLACQRDCVQTSCGHRFCGSCILSWLRRDGEYCPADNTPLTERDIYPDTYTRREILQLTVKCPNAATGCDRVLTVASVEQHLDSCHFQLVDCPNRCSMRTARCQLPQHCASVCMRRTVTCSMCGAKFPLSQQSAHLGACQLLMVACDVCQCPVQRQQLAQHVAEECAGTQLPCHFAELGCKTQWRRAELTQHLRENTQQHMQLLAQAFKRVSGSVCDLSRAVTTLPSPEPPATPPRPTLRPAVSASAAGAGAHSLDSSAETSADSCSSLKHHRSVSAPFDAAVCGASSVTGAAGGSSADLQHRLQMDLTKLDLTLNRKTMSPEQVIKILCEKNVQLEQRSREQAIQIQNLREQLRELSESASLTRQRLSGDLVGRCCNGVFVWRFTSFAAHMRELEENVTLGFHSPGFYTSPFGYRLGLRASLRVLGAERYLALYVHMRRGDNDHCLDWPFSGRFVITLIDQTEGAGRRHLSEVLVAQPHLEAFARPRAERNIKGWGFEQFVSLVRARAQFVRRDTALIRCQVTTDSTVATAN